MLRPVLDKLIEAISAVYEGRLPPQVLSAMASGSGAAVKLFQQAEMEERLRALEAERQKEEDGHD